MCSERDYRHRDVVDKLGIKPGHAVAVPQGVDLIESTLLDRILERTSRPLADGDEWLDIALVPVDDQTDAVAVLTFWRARLKPTGGIWLFSPKRGQPGYVDQRTLIAAGLAAGLVDNKICSVSETTSAMRFVIRRADRPKGW